MQEHRVDHVFEAAMVLLPEPALSNRHTLFLEKLSRDSWALIGGDLDPGPIALAVPFVEVPASFAEGRQKTNHAALADREHGPDGIIQGIADPAGFVHDQQSDSAIAANRFFITGQADDARAVGKGDLQGTLLESFNGPAQGVVLSQNLVLKQLAGLSQSWREQRTRAGASRSAARSAKDAAVVLLPA